MKRIKLFSIPGSIAMIFYSGYGLQAQEAFYQHVISSEIIQGIDTWVADMNGDGFMDILCSSYK